MGGNEATKFIIEVGVALHRAGAPAHRLESALKAISRRLGLDGQFFSTPTQLHAAFGPVGDQSTTLVRVEPGDVNLERLGAVDRVASAVTAGKMTIEAGVAELHEIVAAPPRYGVVTTILAFGLVSAAAARFFGGGAYDVAVSAGIGVLIGILSAVISRLPAAPYVFEFAAAIIASAGAHAAVALGLPISVQMSTLAGLIVLIPGLTLTVGISEIATRNLVSGTARLAAAMVVFLEIGFGVAIAETVLRPILGTVPAIAPIALPPWSEPVALVMAAGAVTVLFRAHPRALPIIGIAAALALYGAQLGASVLGPTLGASLGGFIVATASNAYARFADRPAMIPLVPGILLLVPGSLGFRSFEALLDEDVLSGINTAFTMSLIAISLVAGLLVANVVISPRREL